VRIFRWIHERRAVKGNDPDARLRFRSVIPPFEANKEFWFRMRMLRNHVTVGGRFRDTLANVASERPVLPKGCSDQLCDILLSK